MNRNIRTGINFGIISGVLTVSGIIVGLVSAGAAKEVLAAAVLIIAFADAFSDSLGMYLSVNRADEDKNLWQSLALAFFAKLIIASSYLIPVLLVGSATAMWLSIVWSAILLGVFGYYLGTSDKKNTFGLIAKYLVILAAVSVIAYYIGNIFNGFNLR